MKKALLVIDIQYDYFDGGAFALWKSRETLQNIKEAITIAKANSIPVINIQHIADSNVGIAPFFNEGTYGANVHIELQQAAPDAYLVVKHYADSFYETNLDSLLQSLGVKELFVCGMMTQNCVTHTAISKQAEAYKVTILPDCCTSVNEAIHMIGLHAVSTRVTFASIEELKK